MSENTVADFSLPATGNILFTFSGARGKHLVIYFYPKDNTQGCSTEAQQFRDLYPKFADANCEVVGISRDSLKSHENFKAKFALPFALLSDADEAVCNQFGVSNRKRCTASWCVASNAARLFSTKMPYFAVNGAASRRTAMPGKSWISSPPSTKGM